jgi:hypothetical protein
MASRKKDSKPTSRPATTLESRENQLVAAAIDLAEQQIRDGRASSQVITHFLKLGSTREQLEKERLRHENALLVAKAESIASQAKIEELYENALNAMSLYQGRTNDEVIED